MRVSNEKEMNEERENEQSDSMRKGKVVARA
jgi:hypothetical protein